MIKYIVYSNIDRQIEIIYPNEFWASGGKFTYTADEVKQAHETSCSPYEFYNEYDSLDEALEYFNSFPVWTKIYWGGGMSNPCVVCASYAQLTEWECDEDGEPDTCLRIIGFKAADAEPINI